MVAAGPAASADAAASAYLEVYQGHPSKPVRWLDCKPIQYRINTAGMPAGMTSVVKRVFAIIHEQTGGTFHYAGHTTHKYGSKTHSVTEPTIYISFTKKHHAGGYYLADPGGKIGVGGPWASARSGVTGAGGTWSLTAEISGDLVLYAPARLRTRFGGGLSWQALILHEVGHSLGLGHSASTRDVMYPSMRTNGPGRFSPTEVKHLRSVLQRTGCDYDHLRYLSPRPGGGVYTAPSAPTGVSASATSATTATIRWSAPSSTGGAPVIGYRLARGGSGRGDAAWDRVIPASARSFTFTGLIPNSGYYLEVRPVNALGYGGGMRTLVILPAAG